MNRDYHIVEVIESLTVKHWFLIAPKGTRGLLRPEYVVMTHQAMSEADDAQ